MKICLHEDEQIYLESKDKSFMLKQYRQADTRAKVLGYYGSIERALTAMLDLRILKSEATTINELLNEIRQTKKEISRLVEF